jgi:hypothetical protein
MPQKFSNKARSQLLAAISSADTSFSVVATDAGLFPTANVGTGTLPSAPGDWFKAIIEDSDGYEIVYVRTRSAGSNVFSNVLRGQEGTTARSFPAGAVVGLRVTAQDAETAAKVPDLQAQITGLASSKLDVAATSFGGNAATATKLQTARTLTIGDTGKSFDGSADVSWSLSEILGVGTDMVDMSHTAIMQALGLVSMANASIDALRFGPLQQQGELLIRNRGVVGGCAITRSTTAARNLHIAAGRCFAGGNVFTVAQQDNAASVPPNTGGTAVMVSAYLYPHSSGTYKLAVTAIGQSVPDNGIEIYRLTIPAGSTDATDPYLANVTLTDVRRIEPGYPELLDSPPSVSLAFARPMRGTDWRMDIDVVSATGAPCRADQIVITSRATNGCTLTLGSAADDVRIRWQTTRLHD